jgi:hypothetical protein
MFGHDNDQHNDDTQGMPAVPEPAVNDILASPVPSITPEPPSQTPASSAPDNDDLANLPAPAGVVSGGDLLDIKQQALQQLTPLVGHLDQTPEEKFRTTMMMIQGADNQGLIKDAYAAAEQISDEKAKAQALLDIVNEINYFTQHQANAS